MKPSVCFAPLLLLLASCSGTNNTPIVSSNSCFIDQPISYAVLPVAQNFNVHGWMFDKQSDVKPEHVRIQFISTNRQASKSFEAKLGIERPDVATALNAPTAGMSGFDLDVPANTLASGEYEVIVVQYLPDITLICAHSHMLQVK